MEDNITETKKLVRIYSFHAEERLQNTSNAHTIGRVLSSEETSLEDITKPWRIFFETEDLLNHNRLQLTATLAIEAAKLRTQWNDFQRRSPKDEQIDITTTEPTVASVIDMVANVGRVWQVQKEKSRRGRAVNRFHRFCGTLHAHSTMLEILPKGNEYASLFLGTINSIIKANVNHEKIAEDLALALCTISEHVQECEKELTIFNTEAMQAAVVDLYAHIFLFLTDTMVWYTKKRWKRTLDSFNENLSETFEDEIQNIKHKSKAILRQAIQGMAAEQRVTRLILEESRKDLRLGLENFTRAQAEAAHREEQKRREWREKTENMDYLIGRLRQQLTYEVVMHHPEPNYKAGLLLVKENPGLGTEHRDRCSAQQDLRISRDDLLLSSAELEQFFHRDRIRLESDLFSLVTIDHECLGRLEQWTQSTEIQILAISNPDFDVDELDSPVSLLAAKFIELAADSNMPVISYFAELRRRQKLREKNTMHRQGLIELLYGILRQMAELVPPEFKCDKVLSKIRFHQLDGTADTWDDATALFRDIRELLPGRIFCVIDGFQWLDDKSTAKDLVEFVEILRQSRLKVLFTTNGHSRCLLGYLLQSELLILDRAWNKTSRLEFDEISMEL